MSAKILGSNQYGALPEARLLAFENEIASKLPKEYRDFLLTHNGGKPDPADFEISADMGASTVQGFWGLHDGPAHASLSAGLNTFRQRLPGGLLAIGNDPGGNLVCI